MYYSFVRKGKVLIVEFAPHLPIGSQGGSASPYRDLRDHLEQGDIIGVICDISKSDYEYGDYISTVWTLSYAFKVGCCVLCRAEQKTSVSDLMKLTFDVPIHDSLDEALEYVQG